MDLKIKYNTSALQIQLFDKPAGNMEMHNPLQGRNNGNDSSPKQVSCLCGEMNI